MPIRRRSAAERQKIQEYYRNKAIEQYRKDKAAGAPTKCIVCQHRTRCPAKARGIAKAVKEESIWEGI